ncbi:hypothetical protein H8D30_01625 [bacterium]|nr:hypothetical protein [bacterium]
MPHIVANKPTPFAPLLDLFPQSALSENGNDLWIPWNIPPFPFEVWTHSHVELGRITHRLALSSRTPCALASEVLPLLDKKCQSLSGYETLHRSVPTKWWKAHQGELPLSHLPTHSFPKGSNLEIGFGNSVRLATQPHPTKWWGIEKSRHSIDVALNRNLGLNLIHGSASLLLPALPTARFSKILVLCPDPWPKERHANRRWLQKKSWSHLVRVLAPGGFLGLSTDHPLMASHITSLFDGMGLDPTPTPEDWSMTKYAQKGFKEGRPLQTWSFIRNDESAKVQREQLAKLPPIPPLGRGVIPPRQSSTPDGVLSVKGRGQHQGLGYLHLLHIDPMGNDQPFLLVDRGKGWVWDHLTAPLPTKSLLQSLSSIRPV